jgi:hypothetical protein
VDFRTASAVVGPTTSGVSSFAIVVSFTSQLVVTGPSLFAEVVAHFLGGIGRELSGSGYRFCITPRRRYA